ncbi:acyl-CoA dehydrogenase family protein [Williamsia sp. CHRR-6]|uniref:acyl-CoA dehydrogenase family protein n=1 Tax=Williamsia sp. CHRR-6 TaxID=2835871 RepID=UPI001BDB5636|nr:acyl-CoA dehydrogenase [Williamsia sp. CHRR-6]MBT0567011.1 acyl-CoA dehydrogenase family protein [Williamsia sp. CHRR-6]
MDFELTEEQTLLRDTARDVLTKAYDVEKLRDVAATDDGFNRQVWQSLAEIGLLGLPFAEADGGAGAGPAETSVVMTEIGRAQAPEPYLNAVLAPGTAIAASTDDALRAQVLGAVAEGDLLLAYAHHEPGDRWPRAAIAATATVSGDGHTITGVKNPVLAGNTADKFVVTARLDGAPALFLVDADAAGLTRTPYRTNDRRRGAQLALDATPARLIPVADAEQVIAHVEAVTQVALCAEAVGALETALAQTTDYLKQRKQFGVPLKTFQTLTHRAADMYVEVELARSLSLYATLRLAEGAADAATLSQAKVQIAQSSRLVGQEAIQLHGGIGLTAEYPVGHVVSRLSAISKTLGGADEHLRSLTKSVADHDMLTLI